MCCDVFDGQVEIIVHLAHGLNFIYWPSYSSMV